MEVKSISGEGVASTGNCLGSSLLSFRGIMCDLMTQGVLVKPWQDFHDLKVLWDSTLTFLWLMKLISASFYFDVVIIISPCWSICHPWMLYLHREMSDVANEGIHWNFLIVLATAGHSNPMFIWVDQKEDVAMLLHRLYSFSIAL